MKERTVAPVFIAFRRQQFHPSTARELTDVKRPIEHELLSGLIRIYILHQACEEPILGLGMIEQLQRHGCKLSPGIVCAMLNGLETKGYLHSQEVRLGKTVCRVYRATLAGRKALPKAEEKVKGLLRALLE